MMYEILTQDTYGSAVYTVVGVVEENRARDRIFYRVQDQNIKWYFPASGKLVRVCNDDWLNTLYQEDVYGSMEPTPKVNPCK